MRVVLQVLLKEGHGDYTSLNWDPNQKGNLHMPVLGTGIWNNCQVLIVNASARPPRLAGLPTVGTCNYRYTGI